MITLPIGAAEIVLTALLGKEVKIDWANPLRKSIDDDLYAKMAPKKRGRKPGSKNKVKTAGKRKYTKRSKYWKK